LHKPTEQKVPKPNALQFVIPVFIMKWHSVTARSELHLASSCHGPKLLDVGSISGPNTTGHT